MTKEKKVYIVEVGEDRKYNLIEELDKDNSEAIMNEAEKRGFVYSLKGFQEEVNGEDINLVNYFIYIN